MDIIIFSGQSNMQGESEALTDVNCVPDAYEYKFLDDKIVPLKNPVGENITRERKQGYQPTKAGNAIEWLTNHICGNSCDGHTNLVPEFCRQYTNVTGNQALAVHVAKGSTEISYWLPSEVGYSIIVEKSKAAIKKVEKEYNIGKIYFVWLQGESDAISGNTKTYYKEKLRELCDALKGDLGIDQFGIIRVGRFTNDDRDLEIISAQDEMCAENDDFLMLTDIATELNTQKEYMNPFVGGHYSAKGLEKLGAEAGKALGIAAKDSTKLL